jgi:hypothetical protein
MAGMANWDSIHERNREMGYKVNKHLLIDFNQQILILFLPLVRRSNTKDNRNAGWPKHSTPLTPLRIQLRRLNLSDDLQWLTHIVVKVILHSYHMSIVSHYDFSSSPHPSKTNSTWWHFTVSIIGSR